MSLISFITISREEEKVQALKQSIIDSIGNPGERTLNINGKEVPFNWEMYTADGTALDIFQGYNLGAKKSEEASNFCFLHDDVQFMCNHRVFEKPLELMAKPFTGFIGVAGTKNLPADGKWWGSMEEDCRGMVAHPAPTEVGLHWNVWPFMAAQFGRVAICDGVLLMCSRRTFDKVNGFDHVTFSGFHFYDVDITLRAGLCGLSNYVMPIPILHGSPGRAGEGWENIRRIFALKHKKNLPYRID